jgi:hypothetical protein
VIVNLGRLWPELHAKIRAYDFDWLEQYLGTSIPSALKDIYVNSEVLDLENIIVDEDDDLYFSVAHWQPQNAVGYELLWPGTEGRLILASDGSGNQYHALPNEGFKQVYFFNHETGEMEPFGIDIPTFINKAKEWSDVE